MLLGDMLCLTHKISDRLGKTAGEIATIINITERTVNFHISNAMEKLNCINKTAATVKAALLGLLY